MLGPPAIPNRAAQQIRGTIPFLTYNTLFEACFKKIHCLRLVLKHKLFERSWTAFLSTSCWMKAASRRNKHALTERTYLRKKTMDGHCLTPWVKKKKAATTYVGWQWAAR
jgi:hypothetical protein